jgi:L-alanine-DL-glutamate epimerase-like enolase superfamily enzyme
MKITKIRCTMAAIPYGSLYQLASGATRAATRVFVFIETDEGIVGVGETGATVPERGGETMEAIYANITRRFGPLLIGMNPFDIGPIIDKLEKAHWGRTGFLCLKCGIDNALYDIMGKANAQPVAQLLGGIHRTRFRVSRSIGLKPLEEMAETALSLVEKGYAMLTIKVGFDPKQDIERLAAVRDAVGDKFPLEVDANEGYRAETAVPTLKKMQRYGIEAIEQPVPWWDIAGLKRVRMALDVPITADESAYTPQDVINLARQDAVDTICVKPIKNGGFYLSRRIAEVADAAGLGVLMGSKHPMSPGTAAILHFAAAMPMVHDILGYGSPLERFGDDVAVKPVEMNADGTVDLPAGHGLGVEIDPAKLARFALPDVDWPST